jgi:iron complex transport system ATP-binding protein
MNTLAAQGLVVRLGQRTLLGAHGNGLNFSLRPGWTAVVGPNGAGKTTLLRCLAGLQKPSAGRVELGGQDLAQLPARQRAAQIGWLAQGGAADPVSGDLSVQETVALGRLAHLGLLGTPGAADAQAVQEAMAFTGCSAWAQRALHGLSGGERQRVLLARVLATQAPLLLLDEPTTHLDPPHQVALARLFRRWVSQSRGPQAPQRAASNVNAPQRAASNVNAPQRAVLTVLHDLHLALAADHVVVLQQGQLVAEGAPSQASLQRQLEAVFEGALRIKNDVDGRPRLALNLQA